MKKFLSLVLALVMTMSLVTISAGAKDFTDDEAITYDEAVAVISAVKVVDGYPDGSFKPATNLNRGQAAKVICNLKLGPTTASNLKADAAPFKDVAVDNVFAGYIAFCAKEGIVGGYADGTFKPTAPLTTYAFMKMLLGALGYDAEIEGYNQPNWSINVGKQALGIGLNAGLKSDFDGQKYVTREEACLYAFNTLKATMVDYDTKTTVNVGDASVTIAGSTAKPVSAANSNVQTGISHDGNIKRDGFVQFAEQYFPKLTRKDDTDKFMRPANTWVYDKKDVGTYIDHTKLVETYKEGVSGKTVYDLLKSGTISDNALACYVDGVDNAGITKSKLVRSNNDDLAGTGTGVLTEVYLDKDNELISIVSINTWLAKATADYSEKKEYAPIKVYTGAKGSTTPYNVDVEDVSAVKDVEKDGFYLVTISKKDVTGGEIVSIAPAEVLTDSTVTKFSTKNGTATKLTAAGEERKANAKTFYDKEILDEYNKSLLTDATYNIYLDTYGNFIGIDLFQGTKKYVFITGYDRPRSNLSVKTADAAAIFLDGTMDVIKVNVTDTNKNIGKATTNAKDNYLYFTDWAAGGNEKLNQWYTYTVNESGVYTLTPCVRMTKTVYTQDYTIDTANVYVDDSEYAKLEDNKTQVKGGRVYGEDDSIFLTVDYGAVDGGAKRAITEVTGVYTGVQSVDLEIEITGDVKTNDAKTAQNLNQVVTVYDSDNYIVGAIVIGEASGSVANYAYILSTAKSEEKIGDTYYWEFEAIQGGEVKTLTAKSKYRTTIDELKVGSVQELRFDGDYVTGISSKVNAYTNFTKAIKGEDVYQIEGNDKVNKTDVADKLTLSGRTLYVTEARTDNGLALISDAKAVVIQTENGKKNVKTEFTDVSEALARLADVDDNPANGLQYKGKIYGILNTKGQAEWVVFVSETELKTGVVGGLTVTVKDQDGKEIGKASVAKGDNAIITPVIPAGYVIDEVSSPAVLTKDGKIQVTDVTKNLTINVVTKLIPVETMSIAVEYVTADGAVIESTRAKKMPADPGEDSIAVTAVVPDGYKVVGTLTQYVPFEANTSYTVTFTVALKSTAKTVEDSKGLNDAIKGGAETVYLSDGTYTLTEALTSDLTIIGNGNVTIEATDNDDEGDVKRGLFVTNGNLVVRGVTFEGGLNGIVYTGNGSITIEDCTFKGITGAAIYLGEAAGIAGGTIENCTFTNCVANIAVTSGSLNGNLTITGCDFGATGKVDVVASMAGKVHGLGNDHLNVIANA